MYFIDEFEARWSYLLEECGVNIQTLEVCTAINGCNMGTLEDILYAVTGERTFPFDDEEEEEEEE